MQYKTINSMSEKILNTTILGISVSNWTVIVAVIGFFFYMRSDINSLKDGQTTAKEERKKALDELNDYKKEVAAQRKQDREETKELLKDIKQSLYELKQDFKETYNRR